MVILKDLVVLGQLMGKFALEILSVLIGLMRPFDCSMAMTVGCVVLVVASFHMSVFIYEAPWTLGIFVFLVVCSIKSLLISLNGCFVRNVIPLLVIMGLIKVGKVVVLWVMFILDTIINGFMGGVGISLSDIKRRLSIMENFLSYVMSGPCKGFMRLLKW